MIGRRFAAAVGFTACAALGVFAFPLNAAPADKTTSQIASISSQTATITADDTNANDPCAQNQNENGLVTRTPSFIAQLGVLEAWQLSKGNVLVAVVDSGVDAANPHFAGGAVVAGKDFVGQTDGRTDISGHGTAVAGQIAAREIEGSGVVGMAPESQILPVRVYENDDSETIKAGRGPDSRVTAEGIRWAADQGAVVIAVPMSSTTADADLESAVQYATQKGALVVASAGNVDSANRDASANTLRYPAAYPEVLSVTAVDDSGLPSDNVAKGTHIEVAAPGGNILTTYKGYGDCLLASEYPTTSYATGYTAGAVALVAAMYPSESPTEWEYRMMATALRPNVEKKSESLGWGIIAPYDALNFTNDGTALGPENPKYPAPEKMADPLMVRPSPSVDRGPARRTLVLGISGGGFAVVAATVLASWIRRRKVRASRG